MVYHLEGALSVKRSGHGHRCCCERESSLRWGVGAAGKRGPRTSLEVAGSAGSLCLRLSVLLGADCCSSIWSSGSSYPGALVPAAGCLAKSGDIFGHCNGGRRPWWQLVNRPGVLVTAHGTGHPSPPTVGTRPLRQRCRSRETASGER